MLLLQVNGKKIIQPEDGIHLTVLDGHSGKVMETKGFKNAVLKGIPAQIENYINSMSDKYVHTHTPFIIAIIFLTKWPVP